MIKKLVLKNGLRILLAPQPPSLAATVLVLVEAGSEYETKKTNGLSHFLEHMCFKGTAKRPQPGTIAQELDSLGAEYNAFTGQEYTGYWAKAQKHALPKILDLVSDLYLNPIFNLAEIEKERGVIIQEINMYEDTPMRRVQEYFSSLLYGDQPAGWDIGGRKEIIKKLQRDDFVKYRDAHYRAGSTVVIIAGAFDESAMIQKIKTLFGDLQKGHKPQKSKTHERQSRPQAVVKFKESDQTHMVIGARAFTVFDRRRHALELLANILGGGMSSRLFHRVREELGAAYYVRATPELMIDHGYLAVSAGVDHQKLEKVIAVILEEFRRLRKDFVGADELQKAKDHMIGTLILGMETSDEIAGFYGGQEIITRKVVEPERIIKKIQNITAPEIQAVAHSLFLNPKLNLAVLGPFKKAEPFEKILKL